MHPILVDFGTVTVAGRAIPIVIGGYGLMFSLAVIGGWLWFRGLGRQIAPNAPWTDIYFVMILAGVIGAKVLNGVLFLPDILAGRRTILAAFTGGGVWLGGVLAAVAALSWQIRRAGVRPGVAANISFVMAPFGHAIGRIGCFLGGCCFGSACDWPWAVTYTDPRAQALNGTPLNVPLHPTQIYEAGLELVNFAICWWMWRRRARDWSIMMTWMGLYGAQRVVLELFRSDPRGHTGLLSPSQWIGLGFVGVAAAWWGMAGRSRTGHRGR